jgi:hypothetical protein
VRREWRAATGLLLLVSGVWLARDSRMIVYEDILGVRGDIHKRYQFLTVGCEGQSERFTQLACTNSHLHLIEFIAPVLLLLSAGMLIWIWWKPLKI